MAERSDANEDDDDFERKRKKYGSNWVCLQNNRRQEYTGVMQNIVFLGEVTEKQW